MSVLVDAATAAVGLKVVTLAFLGSVWGRNYVRLGSKHALGLLAFAVLLLLENLVTLYVYHLHGALSTWFGAAVPTAAWRAMLLFHVLEAAALVVLAWTALD